MHRFYQEPIRELLWTSGILYITDYKQQFSPFIIKSSKELFFFLPASELTVQLAVVKFNQ